MRKAMQGSVSGLRANQDGSYILGQRHPHIIGTAYLLTPDFRDFRTFAFNSELIPPRLPAWRRDSFEPEM
jgi:hypothetical protein